MEHSLSRQVIIATALLLVAAASLATGNSSSSSRVSVQTSSGLLHGLRQNLTSASLSGQICKFLSVPYAQAPTGSLRFKRPLPLESKAQTLELDASKVGKTCPQHRHLARFVSPLLNLDSKHETSEDCLRLNLFVPSSILHRANQTTAKAPVIVWLPGEGFDFADARQFDGSFLATKAQAIVVTVQYRVGVLGFLSAPSLGIEGNMGLHDQLEALRWVNGNIANFGGDSNKVTIMGRFSGSMSISALITAPKRELLRNGKNEPLFNKAAMLSGIAVEDWIIDNELAAERRFNKLISTEANPCQQSSNPIECLREIPLEQLLQISEYGWRLTMDNQLVGSIPPVDSIKKEIFFDGLEEVLLGETSQEGTLCLYRHMLQAESNNFAKLIDEDRLTTRDVHQIITDDLNTYFGYNATQTRPVTTAFESLVGGEEDESQSRDVYLNACSTFMVKSHSKRFKRNLLARNELKSNRVNSWKKPVRVFHYELRYKPSFSLAPEYIETAVHGDDIPLIFGLLHAKNSATQKDLIITNKMMNMIGNFARGQNQATSEQSQLSGDLKRSWKSESQIYQIDFDANDCEQMLRKSQPEAANLEVMGNQKWHANQKQQLKVILVEGPETQPLFDILSEQQQPEASFQTRSQRLLEFHRQQQQQHQVELRKDANSQQQQHPSLLSESSFLTILVFSSCVVIMAVLSLFIGFSMILFRNNMSNANKSLQHFASATNACNICDDSHPDSIGNVLSSVGAGKDATRFSNKVFAKLRNHNNPTSGQQQPQSTSSSDNSATGGNGQH